jgi:transmembrane sensor
LEKSVKQLFIDFILNRCSPEEQQGVRELVESGKYEQEWREAMQETEAYFSDDNLRTPNLDEKRLYQQINDAIAKNAVSKRRISWRYVAVAASVLLISGSAWILSGRKVPSGHAIATAKVRPIDTTHKTDHQWIKLPDGSSVQLNSNSELKYPDSFDGKPVREVTLSGEAYFDIVHDSAHPFVIHTGKIKTTVLGTAFNIKAYHPGSDVTVTVTRGKVRVEDEGQILAILTPDQQLAWNAKAGGDRLQKTDVHAEAVIAWKNTDLIMDDVTLEEAAKLLAERYGLKVRFLNDRVKGCRFTAAFLNKSDIEQILDVVSATTGATLALKDNLVTIDGKGC